MVDDGDAGVDDGMREDSFLDLQHGYGGDSEAFRRVSGSHDIRDQSVRAGICLWPDRLRANIRAVWTEDTIVRGLLRVRHISDFCCRGYESADYLRLSVFWGCFCRGASGHCTYMFWRLISANKQVGGQFADIFDPINRSIAMAVFADGITAWVRYHSSESWSASSADVQLSSCSRYFSSSRSF